MDDEQVPFARLHFTGRLRGLVEGTLGLVGIEVSGTIRRRRHIFILSQRPTPITLSRPHPMPARPISSATVSFGLVSVPVHLYAAGETQGSISFNWLDKKDGKRLKQQYVNHEGK